MRISHIFSFFAALLAIITSPVSAKAPVKETKKTSVPNKVSLVDNFAKRMNKPSVMELDFVQRLYSPARNKTVSKKGKAYIQDKSFRWSVGQEVWVYNGNDLYQIDEAQKYAVHFKSMTKKKELDALIEMITDLKALQKKYQVIKETKTPTGLFLQLKSKQKIDIASLDIELEEKGGTKSKFLSVEMKQIVIHYTNGKKTTLDFTGFKTLSKSIPSRLTIPKGFKVKQF